MELEQEQLQETTDPTPVPITLGRLVPAIFLSSVGAVLFSLAIFRLLSFFVMPSMFFALLLVGVLLVLTEGSALAPFIYTLF